MSAEHITCEYERDSEHFRHCRTPHRFVVARADGDLSYSGGREPGAYYVCEEHVAEAMAGMADGDDVNLTVAIRYNAERECEDAMFTFHAATGGDAPCTCGRHVKETWS